MTDKQRILKAIGFYSPLLCEGDNQRFLLSGNQWNYSVLGLAKMKDLIDLHRQISEKHNTIHGLDKTEPSHQNNPPVAKIDEEVTATGRLTFQINCWEDSYKISSDNNKYSQIVAFEIVFRALQQGIDEEVKRLDQGLPMTEGMTKTQFQKHQDALELVGRYKDQQLLELRTEMVAAKKHKKNKPVVKKKLDLVIAPANTALPSMKK